MKASAFRSRVVAGTAILAIAASIAPAAPMPVGDARRGEQLFETEQCIQCHSIKGKGGAIAPDLTRRIDRAYTPAVMASLMWNHAPDMWSAMKKQGIQKGSMTPDSAADLFAYFVSARYFEKPGDAGRGKQAFTEKHCTECHGITASNGAGAPPVVKWESLSDPLVLVEQMWNHGPQMRAAFAGKHLKFIPLTAQELTDMLVYLQNLPETKGLAAKFELPSAENTGEALFNSKGCALCHGGNWSNSYHGHTLTDIAAAMWNHQATMKKSTPNLTQPEMRQLIGYVWSRQYFRGVGSPERGKKVFAEKSCAVCHNDPSSGAPKLGKGRDAHSDITMVAALWEHGPRMLDLMGQKKLAWPRFTAGEMTDLIAYLNSL
jgi:mono/diheme cytochrome c family protein